MRRRDFIKAIAGSATALPLATRVRYVTVSSFLLTGQTTGAQEFKGPTVGVILQGGPWYAVLDGLRAGLKQLGLLEGEQFILDIHDTQGDLKAVEGAANTLERQKVKLIYTVATSVSLAAKHATQNIPIVFVTGTDPTAVQLVETIPRPGDRLSGVYFPATEITGKRLELLQEIVPNLRRVVTFYNPNNRSAITASNEARRAARQLGLELIERHVTSIAELENALQRFNSNEADAYLGISDAMVDSDIQAVIDMGKAKRLPTMVTEPSEVAKGGFAAYSADFNEAGRVSARYVRQILAGASPADLAVEQVNKLLFSINLKTAKHIGLTIPESILIRADKVIE
jgi:putative ABC transport system substrate-binding protein